MLGTFPLVSSLNDHGFSPLKASGFGQDHFCALRTFVSLGLTYHWRGEEGFRAGLFHSVPKSARWKAGSPNSQGSARILTVGSSSAYVCLRRGRDFLSGVTRSCPCSVLSWVWLSA